jgi:hypothetical protein
MNRNETVFIAIQAPNQKMRIELAYDLRHGVARRDFGILLRVESQVIYRLIPPRTREKRHVHVEGAKPWLRAQAKDWGAGCRIHVATERMIYRI